MNPQINSAMNEAIKLLGIHSTWIIGIAFIASHFIHNTFLRRNVWRITMVCLLIVVLFTITGLHQWNSTGIFRPLVSEKLQPPIQSFDSATWNPMKIVNTPDPLLIETTFPQRTNPENQSNAAMNQHRYQPLIIWSYLVGASMVALLMLLNTLWWRKKVLIKSIKVSNPIQNLFNETASKLHFKQSPALLVNEQIKSPLVMGIIRPVMAFPSTFTDLFSSKEQSLIMSHEIAHLREKDAQWQCFSNVISVLLWWNPLVWMARWKLRESAEETADAISICEPTDRSQLAECLIRLGREMTSPQWSSSLSIFGAGFKSQLGKRVDRLVNGKAEWNHAPNRLKSGIIQVSVAFSVFTLLINFSTWLGLSNKPSAKDAFSSSILGITLMAQEKKGDFSAEDPRFKSPEATNPERLSSIESVATEDGPTEGSIAVQSTHNPTLEKLKSTVLSGFTIRTDDLHDNFIRLRRDILKTDPNWTNMVFQIISPVVQYNDQNIGSPSVNANAYFNLNFNSISNSLESVKNSSRNLKPMNSMNTIGVLNSTVYTILHTICECVHGKPKIEVGDNTVYIHLPKEKAPTIIQPMPPSNTDNIVDLKDLPSNSLENTDLDNSQKLLTRTYNTNPHTFLPRVQAIVGAVKRISTKQNQGKEFDFQQMIQQFASNLGIKGLRPIEDQDSKAIYYQKQNGLLYARLTLEDLDLLEVAIQALQDTRETSPHIAVDMQIIQLDVSGIKMLKDMGFEYPADSKDGQFKQIVDPQTLERLYLRMQMGDEIKTLQSPKMTTLAGRQSQMMAQEERTIVTGSKNGVIQTERIKTGPSLTILPKIVTNGNIELNAIFELLEFHGYDEPGPAVVVQIDSKNEQTEPPHTEHATNANKSTNENNTGEGTISLKSRSIQNPQTPLPRFKRLRLISSAQLSSGQTLIMGGLKTTHIVKHKDKVPVLGDIPLMGRLFRSEFIDSSETYIYVFITPRIVDELSYPAASN